MFEKYNISDLYYCVIEDIIPIGMENFGGAISIDYVSSSKYNTVVCLRNGKYYDIYNLGRDMNVLDFPQRNFPITSKDNHLYLINKSTLVPFRIDVPNEYNTLQMLPFGKRRYIK